MDTDLTYLAARICESDHGVTAEQLTTFVGAIAETVGSISTEDAAIDHADEMGSRLIPALLKIMGRRFDESLEQTLKDEWKVESDSGRMNAQCNQRPDPFASALSRSAPEVTLTEAVRERYAQIEWEHVLSLINPIVAVALEIKDAPKDDVECWKCEGEGTFVVDFDETFDFDIGSEGQIREIEFDCDICDGWGVIQS